jgi:hypothetical protein
VNGGKGGGAVEGAGTKEIPKEPAAAPVTPPTRQSPKGQQATHDWSTRGDNRWGPCWSCGEIGHYARDCTKKVPEKTMASGTQLWLDAQLGQRQAQEKGGKGKGEKGGKGGDRGKGKGYLTVTGGRGKGEKGGRY